MGGGNAILPVQGKVLETGESQRSLARAVRKWKHVRKSVFGLKIFKSAGQSMAIRNIKKKIASRKLGGK